MDSRISIHSVARPRPNCLRHSGAGCFISIHSVARPRQQFLFLGTAVRYFNPLGRKTETSIAFLSAVVNTISIHSVARPRQRMRVEREENGAFQSTRSQDRDLSPFTFLVCVYNFNPLGRKTETFSTSQNRPYQKISIHSVARPRHICCTGRPVTPSFQSTRSQDRDTDAKPFISNNHDFNPLGRKTETYDIDYTLAIDIFQSTRSQDRDFPLPYDIKGLTIISIHSVARPRHG